MNDNRRVRTAVIVSWLLSTTSHAVAQNVPDIRLGPATAVFDVPDELFTAITSIRELTDGRVLVADYRENRIALVDFIRMTSIPVGRQGDGPGEFRGAGWLHSMADSATILVDPTSRRWILLRGATRLETFPATHPLISALQSQLNGADRSGHVLGTIALQPSGDPVPSRDNADSLAVVMANWPQASLDTVARIKGRGVGGVCTYLRRGSTSRGGRLAAPPCNRLPSEDLPLLFPDGWISIALTNPYRVDWRTPEGEWIRGGPLPFEPVRIDEAIKCSMLGREPTGMGLAKSCDADQSGWPDVLPAFMARVNAPIDAPLSPMMLATSDGKLLIRRTVVPTSESNRYDLVDRSGALVGRIDLPRGQTIVGFGLSHVYVAESTPDDLQQLRRHAWTPTEG